MKWGGHSCTADGLENGRDVYWCDGWTIERIAFGDRGWTAHATDSNKYAWSNTADTELLCLGDNGELRRFFPWGGEQLELYLRHEGSIEKLQPCASHDCSDNEFCSNNEDGSSFTCIPRPTTTPSTTTTISSEGTVWFVQYEMITDYVEAKDMCRKIAEIKYLIKQWNLHKTEYLGFLTFGQFFCGSDFLKAIDDGRLRIDFTDNRPVYAYSGQTAYKENGNFSKKTLQFM
ncbi:Oidioi.mRNA.OKI2018_I69.chr1.g3717.t1.cds [Oikopleura dioica]|uniref:Oidioi.mRNA.OKI2018_I69.chr1.g3717.t1.cds n=1 Tax=Oikopleura dioica TaxID=34765 RepID=A0ABN7T0I4_OIKDI|nr:Oidioi.mRNA.OKI2018_I69.chr1.g3717.t1.cds [Oikopleura dioica]